LHEELHDRQVDPSKKKPSMQLKHLYIVVLMINICWHELQLLVSIKLGHEMHFPLESMYRLLVLLQERQLLNVHVEHGSTQGWQLLPLSK
jgi:hypothetical protein